MTPPVWTARCKSGYQFRSERGRGRWKACRRMCSRGEIRCAECARAEVIAAERTEGFMGRMASALRASLSIRLSQGVR